MSYWSGAMNNLPDASTMPRVELTGRYVVFIRVGEFYSLLYDGSSKPAALEIYHRALTMNQEPLLCERKRVVVG